MTLFKGVRPTELSCPYIRKCQDPRSSDFSPTLLKVFRKTPKSPLRQKTEKVEDHPTFCNKLNTNVMRLETEVIV